MPDQQLASLMTVTTYREAAEALQQLKCPTCHGLGECDDAEPGDISFRTWKCPKCHGSGFAPAASQDSEPAVPAVLQHGDTHADCGGQWCTYVREEYARPNTFKLAGLRQGRVARFIQMGLMCDNCGLVHQAFIPPDSWIERAAYCAQSILREVLADVVPVKGDGTGAGHLRWMAEELANRNLDSDTKACRWLGYLQGGLVTHGLSTLEREKSRNFNSLSDASTD